MIERSFNLFLKGRYFWNRRNEEDLKKALEIDAQLGKAYASLGYFQFLFDWDWHAAEKNLQRGIALNPRNSWAHAWYGCYPFGMSRFEEACQELRMALEMEPLSPIINAIAGIIISVTAADEGKKQLDKAVEMEPNLALAHFWMGWILMYREIIDEKALEHVLNGPDDYPIHIAPLLSPLDAARGKDVEHLRRNLSRGKFVGELLDSQARRTKEIFVALQKKGDLRKDIRVDLIMHIVENLWNAFTAENLMKI